MKRNEASSSAPQFYHRNGLLFEQALLGWVKMSVGENKTLSDHAGIHGCFRNRNKSCEEGLLGFEIEDTTGIKSR